MDRVLTSRPKQQALAVRSQIPNPRNTYVATNHVEPFSVQAGLGDPPDNCYTFAERLRHLDIATVGLYIMEGNCPDCGRTGAELQLGKPISGWASPMSARRP